MTGASERVRDAAFVPVGLEGAAPELLEVADFGGEFAHGRGSHRTVIFVLLADAAGTGVQVALALARGAPETALAGTRRRALDVRNGGGLQFRRQQGADGGRGRQNQRQHGFPFEERLTTHTL